MATIKQIFEEVKVEYKKVKWPSKDDAVNTTLLVTALSLGISIYIGVFDLLFSEVISKLASVFGG
jgi:preprotein translocase subunit SecE